MYLSRKRFLPDIAGSQFAALSKNSSASYKANLNEICPTKVGGNITSLVGGDVRGLRGVKRERPGALLARGTRAIEQIGRIN